MGLLGHQGKENTFQVFLCLKIYIFPICRYGGLYLQCDIPNKNFNYPFE
jgi:hypothetical protein